MSGERFSDWCPLLGKCWFNRIPSVAGTGESLLSSPVWSPGAFSWSELLQKQRSLPFPSLGSWQSPLSRSSAPWLVLCWTGVFVRLLAPRCCSSVQAAGCLTLWQGCPSWCQHRNWANSGVYPHLALKNTSEVFSRFSPQRKDKQLCS